VLLMLLVSAFFSSSMTTRLVITSLAAPLFYCMSIIAVLLQCFDAVGWVAGRASGL